MKPIQAKQILDEMYFQRYGIDKIKNPIITRNVFDEEMNQGTNAGKDIAELVNKVKGTNFPLNKVISDKLAVAINNLSSEESIKVNDLLTLRRMERYFESVDKKKLSWILIIYEDSITEHKAIIVNQKFLKNFIKIKLTIIILITITSGRKEDKWSGWF